MSEKPKNEGNQWERYIPLFALIFVAAVGATAIWAGVGDGWMHYFMGLLFIQFALLKLFDVEGFADGFQMYDLIAKQNRNYALAYPFIELLLGVGFLSFFLPYLVYVVTIVLMAIGTIGVLVALRKGLDVRCACMGTALNVPLSTVTLTEDVGMGLMALILLLS